MDDLARSLKMNGVWAKRPTRELGEVSITRPTVFQDGVAVTVKWEPFLHLLVFFEWEPDAFYFMEPNHDTLTQLRGAHAAPR